MTSRYAPTVRRPTPASGKPALGAAPRDGFWPGHAAAATSAPRSITCWPTRTGCTRVGLEPVRQAIADADRPGTALGWMRLYKVRALLTGLAAGHRPLTHAALDELPDSKTLRHLRSVLMLAAPPPGTSTSPGSSTGSGRPSPPADAGQKQLLQSYATWHVLRRLRQRLRGIPATCNQAYTARHHIAAAMAFLDTLAHAGLTLATCAQGDLDAWMASASTARKGATGHFVRWAR